MNDKILAMDTSTFSMTMAVLSGLHLRGESNSASERNHSIRLVPMMNHLLEQLHMKPKELDAIIVGQGPGSYTGVRIAVTVAKTMAWALHIPLVGVSSLEALARGGIYPNEQNDQTMQDFADVRTYEVDSAPAGIRVQPDIKGEHKDTIWIVPLMDARRGQVFSSVYAAQLYTSAQPIGLQRWDSLEPDGVRLMSLLLDELKAKLDDRDASLAQPARIVFIGEVEPFRAGIAAFSEALTHVVVEIRAEALRAFHVGVLGIEKLQKGQLEDVYLFAPNYTQLPEAEAKLLANQKTSKDA